MPVEAQHRDVLIDTRQGGLGDVWMRLSGLFTLAGLNAHRSYTVRVPRSMMEVALVVFGDRLRITEDDGAADYTYTSLGARSVLRPIFFGQRYITPYSTFVSNESKRHPLTNALNQYVIRTLDSAGLARSPMAGDVHRYQGYTDIAPLARDAGVSYLDFLGAARHDFAMQRARLNEDWPPSGQGSRMQAPQSPDDLLVFPSGTSRQCMPSVWARTHFPQAHFAFFYKDPLKQQFQEAGLECREFFESPASMLALMAEAGWCVSTDSFASHLLQTYTGRSTLLMTELAAVRVVSPFYDGAVVPSLAPCYPCRKTVRSPGSKCQAGYDECLNWTDAQYALACHRAIDDKTERLLSRGFRSGFSD